MAKSPAVGPAWFEHACPDEFGDNVVDVFGVVSDYRSKQREITGAPDDGGRLGHRHHVRVRMMQPGEQRLVQRLGYSRLASGGVKFADDMFDGERHAVASAPYSGPLGICHRRVQSVVHRL